MTFSCHITALFHYYNPPKSQVWDDDTCTYYATKVRRKSFFVRARRVSMLPNKGRISYLILSCRDGKKNSTSLFENSSSCHCPNWGHARWRGEWGWSRGKMEKQVQQMNNIQQCCHKDFSLGQQLQKYLKIIELIYSFVLCQHSKSVFCITYYCWELQNMRSRNVSANVENQWCDICNNKTDCLKRSISTCFLVIQNISFVCYSGMGEELFMMIDCVKLPPVF